MFNELQAVMNNRAGSPGRFLGWRASLLHSYFSNKNFAHFGLFSRPRKFGSHVNVLLTMHIVKSL